MGPDVLPPKGRLKAKLHGGTSAANGISNGAGKAVFIAGSAPAGCYQTTVAAILAGLRSWDGLTPPNGFCK